MKIKIVSKLNFEFKILIYSNYLAKGCVVSANFKNAYILSPIEIRNLDLEMVYKCC